MKRKIGILISVIAIISIAVIAWLFISQKENKKENVTTNNKQESNKGIWLDNETVNKPVLLEGMQAVIFEEGKEKPIVLKKEKMKQGMWYDYTAQEQTTSKGRNKQMGKCNDCRWKYVGMDSKICL